MSQAAPVVVYVMGQPGAGKSENRHLVSDGLEKATRISGDDFKINDPRYLPALKDNPRTAGTLVRSVYQEWQARVVAGIREMAGHLVIEISPRFPIRCFLGEVAAFRAAHYRVELVVLAVREADSRQGIGLRYARVLRKNPTHARFTETAGHDACFEALPEVVAAVERESAVHALRVVRRDGTVLHRSERGDAGRPAGGAVAAMEGEWRRPYSTEEAARFVANQGLLHRQLPQYAEEWREIAGLAAPLITSVN
ncbi:zeta toxin family protein [Streptomyces sp. NPDC059467]|uniref:zeta toxin family protein n=1 Tax=Streptomyces sp. NPDC059467 TaxID=3346844 RepID=UPI003686AB6C